MRDEENSVDSNSSDKNDDFQGFGKDGGDSSAHENLDKKDDFQGFGGEDSQSAPVENGKKSLGLDDLLDALTFTSASPIASGLRGAARLAGVGRKALRAAEGVGKVRGEVGVDRAEGAGKTIFNSLDDFVNAPSKLNNMNPKDFYNHLQTNRYNPTPLSKGSTAGVSFEQGGGFKVNWGGDRILQYHPGGGVHSGSYWKVSSGPTGTIKVPISGNYIP